MPEIIEMPGAVDLHVHLREPSRNTSETIASGTRAALLGGFALVADMPNNPGEEVWTVERLERKQEIASETAWIPVVFYAGSQPESDNIGQLEKMADQGAIGLKLYGDKTTGNDKTYEAHDFDDIVTEWHRVAPDKPIMFHAGSENLEDMIGVVAIDNYHHLHVCHVNSGEQVATIKSARRRGLEVTSGVTPHHLLKTSHDVKTEGTFAQMMPPLVDQVEVERLMHSLDHELIDVIETDFAPHSIQAKLTAEREGSNCFGEPGIEHVIPLLFYQASKGRIGWNRLEAALSHVPLDILGLNGRRHPVSRAIWDLSEGPYRLDDTDVEAGCGWSPYMGKLALGRLDSLQIGDQRLVRNGGLVRGINR